MHAPRVLVPQALNGCRPSTLPALPSSHPSTLPPLLPLQEQVSSDLVRDCKVQLVRMTVCGLRHLQRRGRLMEGIMWQVSGSPTCVCSALRNTTVEIGAIWRRCSQGRAEELAWAGHDT